MANNKPNLTSMCIVFVPSLIKISHHEVAADEAVAAAGVLPVAEVAVDLEAAVAAAVVVEDLVEEAVVDVVLLEVEVDHPVGEDAVSEFV